MDKKNTAAKKRAPTPKAARSSRTEPKKQTSRQPVDEANTVTTTQWSSKPPTEKGNYWWLRFGWEEPMAVKLMPDYQGNLVNVTVGYKI